MTNKVQYPNLLLEISYSVQDDNDEINELSIALGGLKAKDSTHDDTVYLDAHSDPESSVANDSWDHGDFKIESDETEKDLNLAIGALKHCYGGSESRISGHEKELVKLAKKYEIDGLKVSVLKIIPISNDKEISIERGSCRRG